MPAVRTRHVLLSVSRRQHFNCRDQLLLLRLALFTSGNLSICFVVVSVTFGCVVNAVVILLVFVLFCRVNIATLKPLVSLIVVGWCVLHLAIHGGFALVIGALGGLVLLNFVHEVRHVGGSLVL